MVEAVPRGTAQCPFFRGRVFEAVECRFCKEKVECSAQTSVLRAARVFWSDPLFDRARTRDRCCKSMGTSKWAPSARTAKPSRTSLVGWLS